MPLSFSFIRKQLGNVNLPEDINELQRKLETLTGLPTGAEWSAALSDLADAEAAIARVESRVFDPHDPQWAGGASGNGATDDTDAILAVLTGAGVAGGTVVLRAGSTYATDGTLLPIPANVAVIGGGIGITTIEGRVSLASNTILQDVTIDGADTHGSSTIADDASGVTIARVQFTGSTSHGLYLDDTSASDVRLVDCLINANAANGVQIVDKATAALHYEDITFHRCIFRDNGRMNFECIERGTLGSVTSGYRNISLYDCFFANPGQIDAIDVNVSYDAAMLTDGTARSSGYSMIRGCTIDGGSYGLELAGAIRMDILDNTIRNTTDYPLSVSQVSNEGAWLKITGNRITGVADAVVKGRYNLVANNHIVTSGCALRLGPAKDATVTGNYLQTTGATCVSLENAAGNVFSANRIVGGSNQSVLNIYAGSTSNVFAGNFIDAPTLPFDERDSTYIIQMDNVLANGGAWNPAVDQFNSATRPTPAASSGWARSAQWHQWNSGTTADAPSVWMRDTDGASAWREYAVIRSGATGSRPDATGVRSGTLYFDTTLGHPIWSDGTNWVDATGTTV